MRGRRFLRLTVLSGAASLSALLLGFFAFAAVATRGIDEADVQHDRADGIVVLTGGGARIGEASRLLENGQGRRLLISGVNRKTGREALRRLTSLPDRLFDCCVDVGYAALDTTGNADETRAWAHRHGFGSLIVVTAAYHMPRSLAELGHVLPEVKLVPHPVVPRDFKTKGWWLYPSTARLLAGEYVKLLSSMARLAANWLMWSKEAAAASVPVPIPLPPPQPVAARLPSSSLP